MSIVDWFLFIYANKQKKKHGFLFVDRFLFTLTMGVCVTLCGLAIYIKKHLNAKEELWKLKYFTGQKYTKLQKKSSIKETKILQDIITR